MQTLEAQNLVTREFSLQTFRTADEIFTTAYEHSTVSGNTVTFNVRAPSSSTLMSSVVYLRFRCKVTFAGTGLGFLEPKSDPAYNGGLGARASPFEMCKTDVFAVQQACNSLSLTINGSTINYRPNECLRDLLISQIHKDAIGKLGQPVFDFSDHGFGHVGANGRSSNAARLQDPGYAYGQAEFAQSICSKESEGRDGHPGYQMDRTDSNNDVNSVWVTFVEPLVIGPIGPWSLLKRGVEISGASPFANFSPMIPMVNNMQITMQFD